MPIPRCPTLVDAVRALRLPAWLTLVLALAGSSCTREPKLAVVHRQHLVTLPETARKKSIYVSDDGTDAAFIDERGGGQRVAHVGAEGRLFAEVSPPRMAPGTHDLFYWGLDVSAGKRVVNLIAGGTSISTDLSRPGRFFFSTEGRHWAALGGIQLDSESGEHSAGPVRLWLDGGEPRSHPDMSLPTFSPDGKHVAYLVQDDAGRVKLLADGVEQRVFEAPTVQASSPIKNQPIGPNLPPQYETTYLSDGSLLILSTDREGWAVFRGDTRLASYPRSIWNSSQGYMVFAFGGELDHAAGILLGSLVTAESAPTAVWWERLPGDAERWRVVRDGNPVDDQVCARYWELEPPVLSADGNHVAYPCHASPEGQPVQVYAVHDGKRYGPYDNLWGLALSPDGRRIAYGADGGAPDRPWFYVVDGRRGGLQFDRVFPPRFSPDGRHVAWVGERTGHLILFVDRMGYASSDDLVWAPTFNLGKGLSWAVIRGRRLSRVDVRY